jgi:hypothetical protein
MKLHLAVLTLLLASPLYAKVTGLEVQSIVTDEQALSVMSLTTYVLLITQRSVVQIHPPQPTKS